MYMYLYTHVHIHTYTYIYIHIHICMYIMYIFMRLYICVCMCARLYKIWRTQRCMCDKGMSYGVALVSRIDRNIGLFCKTAL